MCNLVEEEITMENIEQYVLDPENVEAHPHYKMLKSVFEDGDNAVFIDYFFFGEIFHDVIFDEEGMGRLNFDGDSSELSGVEKARLYVEQFSLKSWFEFAQKKAKKISPENSPLNLFKTFLFGVRYQKDPNVVVCSMTDTIKENYFKYVFSDYDLSKIIGPNRQLAPFSSSKDTLLFITKKDFSLLDRIKPEKTLTLITTIEDFQEAGKEFRLSDGVKLVLLDKGKGLRELFYLIIQGILQNSEPVFEELPPKTPIATSYLDRLKLRNFLCLGEIEFKKLGSQKEVYFLGENGDGKTVLLQSILLALKGAYIFEESQHPKNNIPRLLILGHHRRLGQYNHNPLEAFIEGGKMFTYEQDYYLRDIYAYGVHRGHINSLEEADSEGYMTLFTHDEALINPITWLKEVRLKEEFGGKMTFEIAKTLLEDILDNNVIINFNTNGDLEFRERGYQLLDFNHLAEGYRSVLIWVSDLLARLSKNQPEVTETKDFEAIVLVDEVGLHLHPKWEIQIVSKLRKWFPKIQFFFTTHSPVLVMGASKDAVFYRLYKENGVTSISEPYGQGEISDLMANGIITSPLFDLPSATMREASEDYQSDTFLYHKIHQEIEKQVAAIKASGKVYISKDQIDKMVADAVAQYRTE